MVSPRIIMPLTLVLIASVLGTAQAADHAKIFFLHHSTGRNIINDGDMRGVLDDYNQAWGTQFGFWDHDYNYIGLREEEGDHLGYHYSVPNDNTDPDGLYYLWTTANAARDSILDNHQIIAFKSCYPASAIGSDAELETRKGWYREMRDVFDQHPDKTFLVMSQPPLHRLTTNTAHADRARAFASWLVSDEYLAGHPNVIGFDLFDLLAAPDDGSATRNMLRYEYERSHSSDDSHPNALANQTVGPILMGVLAELARSGSVVSVEPGVPPAGGPQLVNAYPNPFNPSTTLTLRMPQDGWAKLEIYDLKGHLVMTPFRGRLEAGLHQVTWLGTGADGAAVASGVYRAVVSGDGGVDSVTMTLVK